MKTKHTPKQVLAWLQQAAAHEAACLAKAKTQRDRQSYRAAEAAYNRAVDYVEGLVPEVVLNTDPSSDDFDQLAAKFEVARWGNGPGISEEDLARVGLKKTKTFKSKAAGRSMKVDDSWESLCCFVFEKMSDDVFPGSGARGRGFRSQECGEHVVKLLLRLAHPQKEAV